MRSHLLTLVIVAGVAAAPGAQAPAFEVASIRPSPEQAPAQGAAGVKITQRQARFSYLSLKDYIGIAHRVRLHQIVAPDWIASARFDIAATIPADGNADALPEMLSALLAERFQLKTHRESREFPVYVLEVAPGGIKFAKAPEAEVEAAFTVTSSGSSAGVAVDLGQGSSLTFGNNRFETKRVTLETLADTLSRFVDRPVVDMTKLEGRYDIGFAIAPEDFQPMMVRSAVNAGIPLPPQALRILDTASIGSVPDALKAIGLSLNARRAPLDVLVVDSIQKTPTEN